MTDERKIYGEILGRTDLLLVRSTDSELVKQEFYGLLMAHFAIRGLMHEAPLRADEDPDRLSVIHSVRRCPTAHGKHSSFAERTPAFGERIQIRAACRQLQGSNTSRR
jgi:hypothetical protein